VACSEKNTTSSLLDTDQVTGSWGRHDAILTDQKLLDTVCGRDLCDDLSDLWVVVATITTNDEESTLSTFGDRLDDTGDKVLGVVLLLEDLDLLAQTRSGDMLVTYTKE